MPFLEKSPILFFWLVIQRLKIRKHCSPRIPHESPEQFVVLVCVASELGAGSRMFGVSANCTHNINYCSGQVHSVFPHIYRIVKHESAVSVMCDISLLGVRVCSMFPLVYRNMESNLPCPQSAASVLAPLVYGRCCGVYRSFLVNFRRFIPKDCLLCIFHHLSFQNGERSNMILWYVARLPSCCKAHNY